MKTRIVKWKGGLALPIPPPVAEEAGLRDDASVDVALVQGKLVIALANKPGLALKRLLEQVAEENLHGEFDTGAPMGKETCSQAPE